MEFQYLESFSLMEREVEELYLNDIRSTCFQTFYPFQVFCYRELPKLRFDTTTIFSGGNGSGKSTLLNIIAEKLGLNRGAPFNRSNFFEDYVAGCDYTLAANDALPPGSKIITSDDVFDFLLHIRCLNQEIDIHREQLFDEYTAKKGANFKMRSLADYEEFKTHNAARRKTRSQFVRERLPENLRERSNGENALRYFTEEIREGALYLLDEPENSLSPRFQLELRQFLADSVRFYGCQFIIATHSPFLLSLPFARIYDLDAAPPQVTAWTELENVRLYHDFFKEHDPEF